MDILKYDRRANNFDFIRFLAAIFVIFTHSFDIQGIGNQETLRIITNNNLSFSYLGLSFFFFISGFLITQSWLGSKTLRSYLANRVLRIFPGLVLMIFLTILVYGPLLTKLSLNAYFADPLTFTYLKNILLFQAQPSLPGVFEKFPNNHINGSLWTLVYEFLFYLVLIIMGKKFFDKNLLLLIAVIAIFILGYWMLNHPEFANKYSQKANMYRGNLVYFAMFFATGSLFYVNREKIPFRKTYFLLVLLIYSVLSTYGSFNLVQLISAPMLGYMILCIAFWPGPLVNFSKYGDFSYGIYIYGYPLQMFFIRSMGIENPWIVFLISTVTVIPFAVFSWHLVEAPALAMKKWFTPSKLEKGHSASFKV